MRSKPLLQRFEPPAGAADPSCQRRSVDRYAVAREDLRLAVQRGVVAVLGDQHLAEQVGCRQALGDRALRRRSLMDVATLPAPILGPADAQHAQRGWHPIEHLADRLADRMQCPATARARCSVDIMRDVPTWQVFGQLPPQLALRARHVGLLGRRRLVTRFGTADVGIEVLEAERQLILVELLGATPELIALQLFDDQPELLDLAVSPLHVGDELAYEALQQGRIVGQGIEIETHAWSLRPTRDSMNPHPAHHDVGYCEMWRRGLVQPARSGRQRRSGMRQLIPSSNMPSCVRVSTTLCPGVCIAGHQNWPCSSRLEKDRVRCRPNTGSSACPPCGRGTRTTAPRTDLPQPFLNQHGPAVEALAHVGVARARGGSSRPTAPSS